jgi:hypothetical protein
MFKTWCSLMDRDRQEAKEYLYNGDFATWLSQIGRADLAQRAREIVTEYPERKYQGLEALAQSNGLVEPPTLEVQPEFFDFGVLTPGARKTLPLKLRNVGRGHLFGLLRSTHPALVFDDKFEGNRHVVPVTFDARQVIAARTAARSSSIRPRARCACRSRHRCALPLRSRHR